MNAQPSLPRRLRLTFVALLLLPACFGDAAKAKAAARQYAEELGYTVLGASCTGTDTDGDGYVSCSLRVEGAAEPILLECTRGEWTLTSGCKGALPKLNVRQTVNR